MRTALKSGRLLRSAVHRNRMLSPEGALERLFTLAFRNLVYAQIWEDPRVDMEALAINAQSRIVTIASGGCNFLSYLTADPQSIHAVDLNAAHVALNRLKLAGFRHLPDHETLYRFFGEANHASNTEVYDNLLKSHLDPSTRAYWGQRDHLGRRRITQFERNFYRYGLLGRFIGIAHTVAKLHGADPRRLMLARSRDEQRSVFEEEISPVFRRRLVRWLLTSPMSLYGLGIPPAQYHELKHGHRSMADVVEQRLERLACDFDLADNYFAWQAFQRRYPNAGLGPLPPYLEAASFETIKSRIGRAAVEQISYTEFLSKQPSQSLDRFVLLDAQDWMDDGALNALWAEIGRTARPASRLIFRTAGERSMLPGRVAEDVLGRWRYEEDASKAFTAQDRSAVYGGFHLYVLDAAG